jgi:hypothetical protein
MSRLLRLSGEKLRTKQTHPEVALSLVFIICPFLSFLCSSSAVYIVVQKQQQHEELVQI